MRLGLPVLFSLMVLAAEPSRAADIPMAALPHGAKPPVSKTAPGLLPGGLRGLATPTPPALLAGPAGLALRPGQPISSSLASAAGDLNQCRLTCAHSYYFCLSSADSTYCPEAWSSCLTDCGRPADPTR
jgi:hypothetical protein